MIHDDDEEELLLSQLQKAQLCNSFDVYQYQGFWCPYVCFHGIITSQKHFEAKHIDIMLTSFPISGTTWLKAITFSIVNRSRYGLQNSPLLTTNPHQLVPFLEFNRLADFLRCSFSEGEEANGVIEEISKLCSFDNIKGLEATKFGKQPDGTRNFSLL
ncbi:hypothetical protein WN943_014384 [Citrus x changshan-huyou]